MESPSPLSRYIPQNSKKRVFPGGTSTCMEAEVVEIPLPTNHGSKSKSLKQKEVIFPEIIDVDLDEDCGDVMLIDEKVVPSGKGKEIIDNLLSDPCDERNKGLVDDAQSSKNGTSGSDNIINADDLGPDSFYGDDKYLDMYYDDIVYDDEYAILQSHFDNLDIPTGIEAPIPWLVGPVANKMKSTTATTSINSTSESKLAAVGLPSGFDSSHSSWTFESVQERKKKSTPGISSTSGTALSRHGQTHSSTWPFPESAQAKSNSTTSSGFSYLNSQLNGPANLSSGEKPPKSHRSHSSSRFKKKHFAFGATPYNSSHTDFSGGESYTSTSIKQQGADDNLVNGGVPTPMIGWQGILNITGHSLGSSWVPQGSIGPSNAVHIFPKEATFSPVVLNSPTAAGTSAIASQSSSTRVEYGNPDEFMKRFQLFKTFDTVQDISDHYYHQQGSAVKQPSKNWAKKIQEEWRILEKDLPDTIFVRVYESRMDLLRAVIVGAEGTPYHDGLFFFDVFFPSSYPNVPPKVHYHSGGLRINPNLYDCGKVCLSLLNTWNGNQKEKWIPGVSTMLQLLVSIQGLILNAKPYFNEPGYASMSGSISGEKNSLQYNERTFILSLKTMVYNIRRPPKYFEDFVAGHFRSHTHDILVACQSYIDGAQVGCLVKGGVQDVDEGDKSCSQVFRYDVANFVNTLIDAFKQVGADECEKFRPLAQRANGPRPVAPHGGTYSFYY